MGNCCDSLMSSPEILMFSGGRKFRIKRKLGDGGYSTVFLVEDTKTRELIAMKRIIIQDNKYEEIARRELSVMEKFSHPNLLAMIDSTRIPSKAVPGCDEVLILMPFFQRGTLQELLDQLRLENQYFREVQILQLFISICEAIAEFHYSSPSLCHRDLKPANILIADDGSPVLMDFGSVLECPILVNTPAEARAVEEEAQVNTTPTIRAPELYQTIPGSVIDEKADIWALGCLLYQLTYLKSPFDYVVDEGSSLPLAIGNGNYTFPQRPRFSEDLIDLIKYILVVDPKQRPNIEQVQTRASALLRRTQLG